jgi:hypothetical protein
MAKRKRYLTATIPEGYPARLNDEINLSIYDRAIVRLDRTSTVDPHGASRTVNILQTFSVALVSRASRARIGAVSAQGLGSQQRPGVGSGSARAP